MVVVVVVVVVSWTTENKTILPRPPLLGPSAILDRHPCPSQARGKRFCVLTTRHSILFVGGGLSIPLRRVRTSGGIFVFVFVVVIHNTIFCFFLYGVRLARFCFARGAGVGARDSSLNYLLPVM
jgi:hypothetical protein